VVRFEPTSPGLKSAILRFASNDPDENPKDVPLEGTGDLCVPDFSFTRTIVTGLNMLGLPLQPCDWPWTLKKFLIHVQGDFLFYYDYTAEVFRFYAGGDTPGFDIPVKGAEAYVVGRVGQPVDVVFTGKAWSNTPPPTNPMQPLDSTNILNVSGTVYDEDGLPVGAGFDVTVTNLDKLISQATTTAADGTYTVGFIGIPDPVAETGDVFEAVVRESGVVRGRAQETYVSGIVMTIDVLFPQVKYFERPFVSGVNMFSVPLDPTGLEPPQTTLADLGLPIDFAFYYDYPAGVFRFSPDLLVPIIGAEGYVGGRVGTTPENHIFEGVGWDNSTTSVAAPQHSVPGVAYTNVFAIVGQVATPMQSATLSSTFDGISLQLHNPRTQQSYSAQLFEDGTYHFVVFDLMRENSVAVGDRLQVRLEDAHHRYQSEQFELLINEEAVRRHQLQLESLELMRLPEETQLLANYPNPFNPETWIPFQLASDGEVMLQIHDASGKLVREFVLGHLRAGHYVHPSRALYWDGQNARGERVASGVYFYTLQVQTSERHLSLTRKLSILK
jgi:hypothetical protein